MVEINTQSNINTDDFENKFNMKNFDNIIRVVIYGSIIIFFACIILYKPLVNKYSLVRAEQCFKAGNYVCAFNNYRTAFNISNENDKFVSNYYKTLSKMKKIAIVQDELNKLLETYPDSDVSEQIKEIFKEIQNKVKKEYPITYIDNVVQGTNIVHWNNYDGKINVFIDKSMANTLPGYYISEVKNAFIEYNKALENALQFNFVNDSKQADILVYYMNDIITNDCKSENCPKVLGLTENDVVGYVLEKSTVKLRTKDTDNTQFTANQIHNIARHEIGHALGIAGHSYFSDDVMYPVSNDASFANNSYTLNIARKDFSTRDLQTLKLLYSIIPDVTNKKYNIKVLSNMYLPIAVIGPKDEIAKKKLDESISYVNMVDENFISQINLAEGYFVNKQYSMAKDSFLAALNLAQTDEEKFVVYNNLAVVLYEEGKYKEAISYAEMANTYSEENVADEIKAYCYIEMKKFSQAERLLVRLVKNIPDNPVLSAALVGVYFKQFKIFSAIGELKRIKNINVDLLSNPAYAPYAFFKNFVW